MTEQAQSISGKKWVVRDAGELENLVLEDCQVPPPGPDEIRIRVRACGLNFADVFTVLGVYGTKPTRSNPVTPGFEMAGVVEAIGGAESQGVSVGQRVWTMGLRGGYATVVNVPADMVFPIPDDWSFAQAAALPVQTFTAYYSLVILGGMDVGNRDSDGGYKSPRKSAVIHSAAGGVGLRALELVQRAGGTAICVVGSESKAQYLGQECGIPRERVIVRGVDCKKPAEFGDVVRERALGDSGAGVDVVLDSYLGDYFGPGWNLLGPGGRYVVIGAASLMPQGGLVPTSLTGIRNLIGMLIRLMTMPSLNLLKHATENKSVSFFNLGTLASQRSHVRDVLASIHALGLSAPHVGKEFSFSDAVAALKFLQSGKSVGKVCLVQGESDGA